MPDRKARRLESDLACLRNEVRTLAANIEFCSIDEPVKVLGITSSVPHEGKTTVSYELGRAMASSGKSVLLMDCDHKNGQLGKKAKMRSREGLYSVLAGESELSQSMVPMDVAGLYLLEIEKSSLDPAAVLATKRFRNLLAELRKSWDLVIIDTPPLSAFVDAAVAAQGADATLLVVRDGYTRREAVLAAYDQLKRAGANVVGTVLNCCRAEPDGYGYGKHYY